MSSHFVSFCAIPAVGSNTLPKYLQNGFQMGPKRGTNVSQMVFRRDDDIMICAAHDICRAPQLCARTKYIRCTLGVVGGAAIQGSCRKMVAWVRMTVSPDAKSIGLPWDMEQAVMGLPPAAVASSQPFISISHPPPSLGNSPCVTVDMQCLFVIPNPRLGCLTGVWGF